VEQEAVMAELEASGSVAAVAAVQFVRASYLKDRGDFAGARDASDRQIALNLELGNEVVAAVSAQQRAMIQMWAGNPEESLRVA